MRAWRSRRQPRAPCCSQGCTRALWASAHPWRPQQPWPARRQSAGSWTVSRLTSACCPRLTPPAATARATRAAGRGTLQQHLPQILSCWQCCGWSAHCLTGTAARPQLAPLAQAQPCQTRGASRGARWWAGCCPRCPPRAARRCLTTHQQLVQLCPPQTHPPHTRHHPHPPPPAPSAPHGGAQKTCAARRPPPPGRRAVCAAAPRAAAAAWAATACAETASAPPTTHSQAQRGRWCKTRGARALLTRTAAARACTWGAWDRCLAWRWRDAQAWWGSR
mmetsp:Transcript_3768/g.9422  ORF Transcript_3768/g.9422 Transcript_3768/m.9422 type:complete len:277 (+) Transcript_3768:371-1201(+)